MITRTGRSFSANHLVALVACVAFACTRVAGLNLSGAAHFSMPALLRLTLAEAAYWLLALVAARAVAMRFDLRAGLSATNLAAHAIAMQLIGAGDAAVHIAAINFLTPGHFPLPWTRLVLLQMALHLRLYGVAVGATYLMASYREVMDESQRLMQLEEQLGRAQSQVLAMQLQPHFLFNTLNVISEVAHRSARTAARLYATLADLLQESLQQNALQTVPLHHEIDFLRRYIALQSVRFPKIDFSVQLEAETESLAVPHFLLQPIVENAIKHGVAPCEESRGRISVRARMLREHDQLEIVVTDDGIGLRPGATKRFGTGLELTRERLRWLYPAHTLEVKAGRLNGCQTRIVIPARQQAMPQEREPDAFASELPAEEQPVRSYRLPHVVALGWLAYGLTHIDLNTIAQTPGLYSINAWRSSLLVAIWAAGSLLALLLTRRFPLRDHSRDALLLVHTCGAVATVAAMIGLQVILVEEPGPMAYSPATLLFWFVQNLEVYTFIVCAGYGVQVWIEARSRAAEAVQLHRELLQARQDLTRWKVQPDFLLPALHGLSRLVQKDVVLADEMTARLGAALRAMLDSARGASRPMGDELAILMELSTAFPAAAAVPRT